MRERAHFIVARITITSVASAYAASAGIYAKIHDSMLSIERR